MVPGRLQGSQALLRRLSQRCLSAAAEGAAQPHTSCLAETRAVIRLSGPQLVHFLQGILTNDVARLEAPGAEPMYSCILNAQGRHLHDLFLHRTQDAEPAVFVDADAAGKEDLLRLLKRYRLRQKVDIADVSQQYQVWARYGGGDGAAAGEAAQPGWAPDPRLQQLGLRAVLPAEAGAPPGARDWRSHRRWRILQGVAEGDSEIPTGEVIPLEFNIDGLHGISFSKGCYVGQELMARTHFKGVVRKRLMPFIAIPAGGDVPSDPQAAAAAAAAKMDSSGSSGGSSSSEALQPGAAVFLEQPSGKRKSVGVVWVADGPLGLAVLRLSAVEAGQPLLVDGGVQLLPWRPQWWPDTWSREEGADADA